MAEKDILKILETGTQDDIKALLLSFKIEHVLKVVKPEIIKSKLGAVDLVKSLFLASVNHTERFYTIYNCILMLLKQNVIPMTLVAELIGVLLEETESLSTTHLTSLTQLFTESLEKGEDLTNRWIEIYPRVISVLSMRETVEIEGNSYSGAGFRAHAIDKLITMRWRIHHVPRIVSLFVDLNLTSEELLKVINKGFERLKDFDIMDTPVLILNLLTLAEKGHRERVLEGIIQFFNEKDKETGVIDSQSSASQDLVQPIEDNPERLLDAKNNVILHISMNIDRNIETLHSLVNVLKDNKVNHEFVLSPFCLTLCLCKKKQSLHNSSPMVKLLKEAIFKCFEEKRNGQKSNWLRNLKHNDFNVSSSFVNIIKNSKEGWDFLENLVDFALDLLNVYGSKTRVSRSAEEGNYTPEDCCYILGQDILIEAYKVHYYIMPTVLESLLHLMWIRTYPSVLNIIDLIDIFIITNPGPFIASCQNILKQFIEFLPSLHPEAAFYLLNAFMPLLKKSVVLKDSLMLVLRKSMSNRKANARKVSAMGYLTVLKNFKVLGRIPFSQSQESCSDTSGSISQAVIECHKSKYNISANEGLCYELIDILKFSLSRHGDIKQMVYECLSEVMKKNPNLASNIFQLLFDQFDKYFQWREEVCPPIKLKACVEVKLDDPAISEPMGYLIYSICSCITTYKNLQLQEDEGDIVALVSKLENALKSLVKRVISSYLEDFELDKTTEFRNNSSIGIKNQMLASELLGVIEVLMDYIFKTGKLNPDTLKDFLSLFEKHQRLTSIVLEKSTAATGKPKGKKQRKASGENADTSEGEQSTTLNATVMPPPSTKEKGLKPKNFFATRNSLLSLEMIAELLQLLYFDTDCEHPDSRDLLKGNESLIRFCLETIEQNIVRFPSYESNDELCGISASLTKSLMKIYNSDFDEEGAETQIKKKKRNQRTIPLMCMELLVKLTKYFADLSDKKLLLKFLCHLKSRAFQTQDSLVSDVTFLTLSGSLVKTFQKNIVKRLAEDSDELQAAEKTIFFKELTCMINFITLWATRAECYLKIREDNEQINPSCFSYRWVKDMCIQQNLEDPHCCAAFVTLFLELSHQQKTNENPYMDLSKALQKVLGSINDESQSEEESDYSVVNVKSAKLILNILIQNLERILREISSVLDIARAGGAQIDKNNMENRCCKRLGQIIFVASEILQISVKTGIDVIAKFVIKIYNILLSLTKHYIGLYSKKSPKTPPKICGNFEKVVKLCGTSFNPAVNSFITYVEEKSNQDDGPASKKPRKIQAEKNLVIRETKQIPNLVFAQEQFFHFLVILGKKAKIDFSANIKAAQSRDFRINIDKVRENIDGEQEEDEDALDESRKNSAKRRKKNPKSSTQKENENEDPNALVNLSQETIPIERSPQSSPEPPAPTPIKSQTARRGGRLGLSRKK